MQNTKKVDIKNTKFITNNIKVQEEREGIKPIPTIGGTILLENSDSFSFKNSSIKHTSALYKGGALYLLSLKNLLIESSTFEDASVKFSKEMPDSEKNDEYLLSQGGAIYFEPRIFETNIIPSLKVSKSTFKDCLASSGGAILISQKSSQKIDLSIDTVSFLSNAADLGPSIRILGKLTEEQIESLKSKIKVKENE